MGDWVVGGIGMGDWGMGLRIGNGDWYKELYVELGLGLGNRDLDWGLVVG